MMELGVMRDGISISHLPSLHCELKVSLLTLAATMDLA